MSLSLVVFIGVLFAAGTYLILQRTMTRIIIGVAVLSNGVNFLILAAGSREGGAPLVGGSDAPADPVPQALILTAIVIGFALVAFLAALALRLHSIDGNDVVEDDVEDRRTERLAALAAESGDSPDHEDVG
jgi:multicomponent Na+:H+ antiporter subunit C